MKPSLTAIQRALDIAKQIGEKVDPGFGGVDFPKVGTGVPLERADGGETDAPDYSQPDGYMNLYSKAAAIASQLPMQRASPAEWRGALLNRGVKPAEIKWSEFENRYPGNEPISREDVASHFHRFQPDLYETDLRGRDTQYDHWTMPGGERYREVLLHETNPDEVRHQHAHWTEIGGNDNPWDDEDGPQDIPNVYVHARLKDRKTPSGAKVLHVEELQSDWGQEGRKGFRDPDPKKVPQDTEAQERHSNYVRDLLQRTGYDFDPASPMRNAHEAAQKAGELETLLEHGRAMLDERKANIRRMNAPIEGPYVGSTNDWVDLGLKHLLSTAAANDHEHLAWTPGQIQAEHYPEDDEGKKTARLKGMQKFYDDILPKRLLKLARMHDPDAQLGQVGVSTRRNWDRAGEDNFESLPSLKITPKMRESILKRGFPAYAEGGAVGDDDGGDDGHPLTNPVYHGIKEQSVSNPMAQGLDMEMFDAKHPSLNFNAPNHIALGLGPHVSRDPNIAGDYRFTTGEEYEQGVRKGAKPKGRVMMLNTLPDEKFLPVRQKFNSYGRPEKPSRDYDDNAVYNTVYSDVFRNNPKLAREVLIGHGHDPESADHYVKSFQTGEPFTDPWMGSAGYPYQTVEDFVATHGMLRPGKRVINKVLRDFRKRMRDRGYAGLSYINTDEDETSENANPSQQVEDKKCYIVFPQRDKETGWYPMRLRHAAYDPQQKGSPVLTRAAGGETDAAPENPYGGLAFPREDTEARLRTSMNREAAIASGKKPDVGMPKNPRTVIKAPVAEEGEKQLPDFTTGQIDFNDWKKRHENILSDSEIHHSANWYKNIYGNFLQYYPDPKEAKRMMRAWLVAQQNVSPAGAMNNVLMQREQMERGDPEHLWTAGGMPNPTAAARNVLRGQEIGGGVGQKISDFVDSAEGKGTRSWMGDHPHGGDPFVVDVHTARDTGMVDQELINHLSRLGYNKDQLEGLKVDLLGSPTEAAYENRAKFGRKLTKHLNSIGWKGRSDWTPAEVQAVGWMGMTKLTRNAEEDSESGLGRNLRRISYELAPGEGSPWEHKYGEALAALPEADRYAITHKMADSAMKHAQKLAGINLHSLVHGTGAWENWQNPSSVGQTLATQRGADIASAALGHLLHQTEVWHNRVKPMSKNPKGFALDFVEKGSKNLADPERLRDFWSKVMEADPHGLVRGYQPITMPTGEVGIRALIDKGGAKTQAALEGLLAPHGEDKRNPFRAMLESLPFDLDVHGHEAEITKHRNDWKEQKNGEGYISRLVELLGRNPSSALNSAGNQLAREFESHLDEAHARQGTSWRKAPGKAGKVGYALGGIPKSPRTPFVGNSPGSVERALLIAKKMRYG